MRKPYLDDGDVRLYLGDCIEVMAEMDEGSMDAVVCDPPYGLEFMGKEWDAPKPSWDKRGQGKERGFVGKARAPVPGFSAYVAGSPFQSWTLEWAREALRVLKPGGHLLAFGGTRTFHRLTCGIEDAGFEVRDCLSWLYGSGFPKSLDVSKAIDKAAGAEPIDLGQSPNWRESKRDREQHGGMEVRGENAGRITAPATDAAREWQGWGTALKPAWEPCLVARKPLAGTVAANVHEHGTGALNIDGCRIGTDGGGTHCTNRDEYGRCMGHRNAGRSTAGETFHGPDTAGGRWPANVALDEDAAALLDAQSGERTSPPTYTRSTAVSGVVYPLGAKDAGSQQIGYGDSGGASRFYYTAKASRADRNTSGANNTHPTVKPTDLMRWLVRMVTPPGGVVLDPFAGSGSTLVAARAEGFRAIGIEREDEYAEIIAQRLAQLSLLSDWGTE
jgi:DNA modification methylase